MKKGYSYRLRACAAMTACLFILFVSSNLVAQVPPSTALVGHWTFEEGSELKDLTGNFSDLVLEGGIVANGALDVGNRGWASTIGYTGPPIIEKTLVAWVRLDALTVNDPTFSGGSALTLDMTDVDQFDGIVFAERQAGRWMAGSNNYSRTTDPFPGFEETTTGELVQIAICYKIGNKIGAEINIYRNGTLIGTDNKGILPSFSGATTEVLFGLRHTPPGGGFPSRPFLDAKIEEARIYGECLTANQISALSIGQPIPTMGQWGTWILGLLISSLALVYIRRREVAKSYI